MLPEGDNFEDADRLTIAVSLYRDYTCISRITGDQMTYCILLGQMLFGGGG